jgi:hypothetical protein
MANNPLQQFFRQPKVFISLPSQGVYNNPGTINGDVTHLPVYGMTGMDEIIIKTPDALLSGDSTARVINSCCPAITDPWDLSNLDTDLVLTAIRIATYGNEMHVTNKCSKCETESDYTIDLNAIIDHFGTCKYDNRIVLDKLVITIRPLTYKQSTDFSVKNFQLQQQLKQIDSIESEEEKKEFMNTVFLDIAKIRNEVFAAGIESVDTGAVTVTERAYIEEWITNVDRSVIDVIRKHIEKNQNTWTTPLQEVVCDHCGHKDKVSVTLDQSSFFGLA